jgi:hypothetical protein
VGSSAVEGTSQAVLGSSDQWKVPASLSLFLKSEKIPTLLYLGKGLEYRPFCDFRPVPSAYQPQAQISNHGRACTWALLLCKSYCWGRLGVTDFCVFIRSSTQDLINMMDRLILSFFFSSASILSIWGVHISSVQFLANFFHWCPKLSPSGEAMNMTYEDLRVQDE